MVGYDYWEIMAFCLRTCGSLLLSRINDSVYLFIFQISTAISFLPLRSLFIGFSISSMSLLMQREHDTKYFAMWLHSCTVDKPLIFACSGSGMAPGGL